MNKNKVAIPAVPLAPQEASVSSRMGLKQGPSLQDRQMVSTCATPYPPAEVCLAPESSPLWIRPPSDCQAFLVGFTLWLWESRPCPAGGDFLSVGQGRDECHSPERVFF